MSLPRAAVDQVVALAADEEVVAVAAVEGQADHARPAGREASTVSSPPRALTVELVVGRLGAGDVHRGGQARRRRRRPAVPATCDAVVAGGAVDDDGVGRAVAGAAAARPRGRVDVGDVGAGQVVDGDRVGAAEGVEVDLLDAVEVHRDVPTSRVNRSAAAVGGEVDVLGDVGAVEEHRVDAVLAFDDVAAVAGVPHEGVVAGAQEGDVVAAAAVDEVVAVAADQRVVALAADDRVVAGAAVDA